MPKAPYCYEENLLSRHSLAWVLIQLSPLPDPGFFCPTVPPCLLGNTVSQQEEEESAKGSKGWRLQNLKEQRPEIAVCLRVAGDPSGAWPLRTQGLTCAASLARDVTDAPFILSRLLLSKAHVSGFAAYSYSHCSGAMFPARILSAIPTALSISFSHLPILLDIYFILHY